MHWQLVLENTGNDVVLIIPMCFIYNVRFDVFIKRLSHLPFFFVKDTERCPDNRKKSYRRVVLCSHLTSLGCWRIPHPSSSGPSNWDLKQKAEMATADRWPSQDGPLLSSQVLSLLQQMNLLLLSTNPQHPRCWDDNLLVFGYCQDEANDVILRGKSWDTIPVCVPWYVKLECAVFVILIWPLRETEWACKQGNTGRHGMPGISGCYGIVFNRSRFLEKPFPIILASNMSYVFKI